MTKTEIKLLMDGTQESKIDSAHIPNAPANENSSRQVDQTKKTYGRDLNPHDMISAGKENSVLFEILQETYQIGEIINVDYPSSVSSTSRKAIIETTEGTFFLKEKPAYSCSETALRTSAMFQDYLSQQLSFVPAIRKTVSGEPYARVGNNYFLLTEFVEGRFYNATNNDIALAAKALGSIHIASIDMDEVSRLLIKTSLNDAQVFLELAANLTGSENDQWKEETIKRLKAILELSQRNATKVPTIVNHGDYAPYNMVYNDGSLVAVNDFDNSAVFPRVRDLADPVLMFGDGMNYAGATSSFRRPVSRKFNIEKAKLFLSNYFDYAPELSIQERTQLLNEVRNRWVELMCLGIVRGDFAYYDVLQAFEFIDFLHDNFDRII